ncbi:MAG TPA: exonuclease SbcCD subunit D [Myxococcaceae bacterium]|nr:exonuclease SbcCD subunit D [Myxococcaceae bacterium]
MRLIHTSDWHLGRKLHDHPLIDVQAHALEQLVRLCIDEEADALVIAGDLFDRAIPPEEAVRLFDAFLRRMSREVKIPVVAISGNHDSAERLAFGADFLALGGIHLKTRFEGRVEPVVLRARGEEVHVYGLPYQEPTHVRAMLGAADIRSHDDALKAALAAIHERRKQHVAKSVLVAHLFARGGSESPESERSLEIGGAAQVDAASLDGFDYVALGHLHAPQRVGGREDIRYSGSLCKYSVGEARQRKGVTRVDLGADGVSVRELPLKPLRDVVRLEASLHDLLHAPAYEVHRGDFVEVVFTDPGFHLDVAARLRERFPYLLAARPALLVAPDHAPQDAPRPEFALAQSRELLESFWEHVQDTPEPLEALHHALFQEVVKCVERGETVRVRGEEVAA